MSTTKGVPDAKQVYSSKEVSKLTDDYFAASLKDGGLDTGFWGLHKAGMRPWQKEWKIGVLAYTSNGKTMFMNRVARNVAEAIQKSGNEKRIVVTATWEQSVEEHGIMDAAYISGIPFTAVDNGFNPEQLKKFKEGIEKRAFLPWWIIGHSVQQRRAPQLNIDQIRENLFRIQDFGIEVVLLNLDYLQIINMNAEKGDRREKVIATMVKIGSLPKELGCPVVIASQADREVNKRDVAMPEPWEAMESSSFEHTVDLGISLWMPGKIPVGKKIVIGGNSLMNALNTQIIYVWKQRYGKRLFYVPYWLRPEIQQYNLLDWMTPEEIQTYDEAHKKYK